MKVGEGIGFNRFQSVGENEMQDFEECRKLQIVEERRAERKRRIQIGGYLLLIALLILGLVPSVMKLLGR